MTKTELNRNRENPRGRATCVVICSLLTAALAFGAATSAIADESESDKARWTFRFEPTFTSTYGHDRHVLTVHEIDVGDSVNKSGFNLEVDPKLAFRTEFQFEKGRWGIGADVWVLLTSQDLADQTATAGSFERVGFEVVGRTYYSTEADEVLYYNRLTDTDLQLWTTDLYAIRRLTDDSASDLELRFGLRLGDFDNDYHAQVGILGVEGSRVDSSSNYELMMGPLVGLAGKLYRGKNTVEAYLGQSVIVGQAELSSTTSDFTGAPEDEAYFYQETFRRTVDAAVPITELRIRWDYRFNRLLSAGIGLNSSVWWDVPVPPGTVPGDPEQLHRSTIVFYGIAVALEISF